jgi:hypothetical protein
MWVLSGLPSAAAKDAAFCVTCRGPDQTYLCRVTGAPRSDALKLYCVIRTAKEGGHASCGARDDAEGCPGVLKEYAYTGPDLPAGFAVKEEIPGAPTPLQDTAERKGGPKTLAEAIAASRRGIRRYRESRRREREQEQAPLPADSPAAALPEVPTEAAASAPPAPPASASAELEPQAEQSDKPKTALGRGVKNMGSFARNSVRCMRSFFRGCREKREAQQPAQQP